MICLSSSWVVGFIPGPSEPSSEQVLDYLELIVKELEALHDNGVLADVFGLGEQTIFAIISIFIGDAPARANCCGFSYVSGRRGCPDCGHKFPRIYSDKGV